MPSNIWNMALGVAELLLCAKKTDPFSIRSCASLQCIMHISRNMHGVVMVLGRPSQVEGDSLRAVTPLRRSACMFLEICMMH